MKFAEADAKLHAAWKLIQEARESGPYTAEEAKHLTRAERAIAATQHRSQLRVQADNILADNHAAGVVVNLTEPQQRVLSQFATERGVDADSLATLCGMYTSAVSRVLNHLQAKGLVSSYAGLWDASEDGKLIAQAICDEPLVAL